MTDKNGWQLTSSHPRFLTAPVDYDAWRRGYQPPSEHIVIHKLMHGELRVSCASEMPPEGAYWILVSPDTDYAMLADVLRWQADHYASIADRKQKAVAEPVLEPEPSPPDEPE